MMPTVSVIIPAYNQARYLGYALDSVLGQTFQDWECIIVDDGSTDETAEIARKYTEKDKRFKYIYQQNRGLAGARNTGLEQARGDFIQFLDSDDLIERHKLEIQVNALVKNPSCSVANSDVIFFWGRSVEECTRIEYFNLGFLYDQLGRLIKIDGRIPSPVHCFLLRKEVFENIGVFDESFHANEDRLFWSKYCLNGGKFSYTSGYLAYYRQSPDSLSYSFETMYRAHNKYIDTILPLIERSGIDDSERYVSELIRRKYQLILSSLGKIKTNELYGDFCTLCEYARKRPQIKESQLRLNYLRRAISIQRVPLFCLLVKLYRRVMPRVSLISARISAKLRLYRRNAGGKPG